MDDDPHAPARPSRGRARLRGLASAALALAALGTAGAGAVYAATDVPLAKRDARAQASVVEWSDGTELARLGAYDRIDVPLGRVSVAAQHAVLAAEDREFYREPGVSPKGIVRAAWANLRGGGIEQGASTITQQYVKNAYLSSERTWRRKVAEVVIATKLDRTHSKDRVLELYLNTVYFGRGAYGIEVAAQTWFGKPAAELTAAEGAVLAAVLRSPSGYDPAKAPERARERWRYVLDGMAREGWLETPVDAVAYPAVLPPRGRSHLAGPQGHLVHAVEQELERRGVGEGLVAAAGLRIRTTFDRRAQAAAVEAVQGVSGRTAPDGLRRALVSVQPGTGRVRAMYGGDDYVGRPFNDATQGVAQAGSSFKPYVLAAALEGGMSMRERLDGRSPQAFGDYVVRNYADTSHGEVDLVEATAQSVNTAYVALGMRAGLPEVAATAAALGIGADMSREDGMRSLPLGVTAVRPLDQAVAYATLAARGVRADAYVVEHVRWSDGRTLWRAQVRPERVVRTSTADDTLWALQQVVERGTGRAARLPGRPVAGKTGTTSGNTAAWFVGATPQLSTAVVLFSERADVPLRGIAGVDEVTGGSLPARTWARFTAAALQGVPARAFPPPQWGGTAPSPSPTVSASASPSAAATPPATAAPSPTAVPSPSPPPSAVPVQTWAYQPPPTREPYVAPTSQTGASAEEPTSAPVRGRTARTSASPSPSYGGTG